MKRIDKLEQNLVINGALDLWQRGVGATQSISARQYLAADRFAVNRQTSAVGSGAINMTRQTDVPSRLLSGFNTRYSMRLRVDTDNTTGDPNFHALEHLIEGHEIPALVENAGIVSFWAKSNKLGTYHLSVFNSDNSFNYIIPFEVDESLVWKKYSFLVDFSGAPNANWAFDNTQGIYLKWWFFASGEKTGSPATNQWAAFDVNAQVPSTQVNFMDNVSNDFFLTNISVIPVEKDFRSDVIDLPFRRAGRNFQEELYLAQRYYEKNTDISLFPPSGNQDSKAGYTTSANVLVSGRFSYKNTKRAVPTVTVFDLAGNPGQAHVQRDVIGGSGSNVPVGISGESSIAGFNLNLGGQTPGDSGRFICDWNADAEL